MQKNIINNTEEKCDLSRRELLKKSYVAPAIIALGSMSFTTEAKAGMFGNYKYGNSKGGSSLSGGGYSHHGNHGYHGHH